jgi:hypothetical protein
VVRCFKDKANGIQYCHEFTNENPIFFRTNSCIRGDVAAAVRGATAPGFPLQVRPRTCTTRFGLFTAIPAAARCSYEMLTNYQPLLWVYLMAWQSLSYEIHTCFLKNSPSRNFMLKISFEPLTRIFEDKSIISLKGLPYSFV